MKLLSFSEYFLFTLQFLSYMYLITFSFVDGMMMNRILICAFNFIVFSKCEIIEIGDGKLEGTVMQTRKSIEFHAFLKIPYAEPPIGNLRFQPPVQNRKWEGVLNATIYGPICMQYLYDSMYGESEDCLHLNVFTKSLGNKNGLKPVIVYIHGGVSMLQFYKLSYITSVFQGFEYGAGSSNGPSYLMDRDIVLITINYRLGPFGFLALGTKEATGNMGLKDQVMALKWIQRNIIYFGGDPNSITIAGLSAGAYSTTAHMASPLSKGLFIRVISLSGAITWQKGFQKK
jgi:carboxylesterase type B